MHLIVYPYAAGFKTAGTSAEAAGQVTPQVSELQRMVVGVLFAAPLTADEVAKTLNRSVLLIRPRLSELAKMGMIADSWITRKNDSGKSATVWRLA